MTLKSRLSRLQAQAGVKPAQAAKATASSVQSRLAHLRPERLQANPHRIQPDMSFEELTRAVNGNRLAEGLIKIEEQIPLIGTLGNTQLSGLVTTPPLPGEVETKPSLYIDTETTGLSGGSGTLAFLVGVAEVTRTHIQFTQFLITRFSAESELLAELSALLSNDYRLVSYNGKSYDLPLIMTRFRMLGLKMSLHKHEHLDLLHPVRRLLAKRWEDCRLPTVEKRLLGFKRKDDLPGAEAPEAWFAYMQRGDGERLIKVVEHNRQDIISLAVIHHATGLAVQQPVQWGVDLHGLARWLLEVNETEALCLLQDNRESLCDDGKRLLGYLLRRAERWVDAVNLWEELSSRGCVDSIERLAKYHEHISKDLHTALHYCMRLPGSKQDAHRRTRIEEKLYMHQQEEIPCQARII